MGSGTDPQTKMNLVHFYLSQNLLVEEKSAYNANNVIFDGTDRHWPSIGEAIGSYSSGAERNQTKASLPSFPHFNYWA